jgi:hypothetical protein
MVSFTAMVGPPYLPPSLGLRSGYNTDNFTVMVDPLGRTPPRTATLARSSPTIPGISADNFTAMMDPQLLDPMASKDGTNTATATALVDLLQYRPASRPGRKMARHTERMALQLLHSMMGKSC